MHDESVVHITNFGGVDNNLDGIVGRWMRCGDAMGEGGERKKGGIDSKGWGGA